MSLYNKHFTQILWWFLNYKTGHKGPGEVFSHEPESLVSAVKITPVVWFLLTMYNLPGCPIEQANRLHRAWEALPCPVISARVQRTLQPFTFTRGDVGTAAFWSSRFDVLCSKEPCIRGVWSVLVLSNDVAFPQRRGKPVCNRRVLTLMAVSSPALLQPLVNYL